MLTIRAQGSGKTRVWRQVRREQVPTHSLTRITNGSKAGDGRGVLGNKGLNMEQQKVYHFFRNGKGITAGRSEGMFIILFFIIFWKWALTQDGRVFTTRGRLSQERGASSQGGDVSSNTNPS